MAERTIAHWDEFRAFAADRPPAGTFYLWRGQQDARWPLASSLERKVIAGLRGASRCPEPHGVEGCRLRRGYDQHAEQHLALFKRAAEGLRGPNPKGLDDEEWWCLGRHHGLLTPLVDWTRKPYIALFFALADMVGDNPFADRDRPFAIFRLTVDDRLLGPGDVAIVDRPIEELSRLHRQRGVFTWIRQGCHFDLNSLLEATGRGDLLVKGTLSPALVEEALRDLDSHGLDFRLLFPDLEGAARDANARLPWTL